LQSGGRWWADDAFLAGGGFSENAGKLRIGFVTLCEGWKLQ